MNMKFIAEIGLNYNGNFGLCYELIRQAKFAGADIAKFQLGWRGKEGEMNHLSTEQVKELKKWGDYFEIDVLFSVFTSDAFNILKEINISQYKIASRTVKDDLDLVKRVVDENKPTYISLGMWDKDELPIENRDNVLYFWCKSVYPSTPWDMLDLPKDFTNSPYTGYSDHTIGIDTCLLAIARGATVIEKHFTLDKSDTTIRDHALSCTPAEYRTMVEIGREMYKKINLGV
jgi:sialic acid synthase SpsE